MSYIPTWRRYFPELSDLSAPCTRILDMKCMYRWFARGHHILAPAAEPGDLVLLVAGTVYRRETGAPLTLMRFHASPDLGATLATACQLAFPRALSEVVAETEVEAVILPRCDLDSLMLQSAALRGRMFNACAGLVTDMQFQKADHGLMNDPADAVPDGLPHLFYFSPAGCV